MVFTLSGTTITQSGTDDDYSGLSAIAGVTTKTHNDLKIYEIGELRLEVTGTISHDPAKEMVVSTYGGTLMETPIITNTGTYNYGKKTESNGNIRYSALPGLYRTGEETNRPPPGNEYVSQTEWRGWNYAFLYFPSGTFQSYGGVIPSSRVIQFGRDGEAAMDITIEKTRFVKVGTTRRREIRFDNPTAINGSVDMIIDGFQVSHRALPATAKFELVNGQIVQLARGPTSATLTDLDASKNIDQYTDLGSDSQDGGSKTYIVNNSENGTNLRFMPKSGVGNTRQQGVLRVFKNAEYRL